MCHIYYTGFLFHFNETHPAYPAYQLILNDFIIPLNMATTTFHDLNSVFPNPRFPNLPECLF